tara:strand:+ start:577 stop:741 length:165 start_codon:yes stop_codon:yes gene_type:complete
MRKSEGVAFTVWLGNLIENEVNLFRLRTLYDSNLDTEYVNDILSTIDWSVLNNE